MEVRLTGLHGLLFSNLGAVVVFSLGNVTVGVRAFVVVLRIGEEHLVEHPEGREFEGAVVLLAPEHIKGVFE